MLYILSKTQFFFRYVFFCLKMPIIPIFYQFFSIFAHFYHFRPNFVASLFFSIFLIDNNLSCVLYSRIPSFYNFLYIFCVKMHIIPIFYQFLLILKNFAPTFFPYVFQLIITYNLFFN